MQKLGRTPWIIIAGVAFLFIIIPLLNRSHHSSGLTDKQRAAITRDALASIDRGELEYRASHHRYTEHVADLLAASPALARDLASGVTVSLDASSGGQVYILQLNSPVLALFQTRVGDRIAAHGCLVLKSSSGVDCPKTAAKKK